MLTYEASAKIFKKFPWLKEHKRDLELCLNDEAEYYWQRDGRGGVPYSDFTEAVDIAFDFMLEWFERAHEFHVDVDDLEDLSRFVAGHRRACVWAVLISRHHNRTA